MAKQRSGSRVAPRKAAKAAVRAARPPARAGKASRPARKAAPARKTAPAVTRKKNPVPSPPPAGRKPAAAPVDTAQDRNVAVEKFEKGFRAFQQRRFAEAAELFKAVIAQYPDEKELLERVRVYLVVCMRQAAPPDATPKSFEERVYAATLSVNRGAYDEGMALLTALEREQPEHEHIQYMLAVVCTQRGDVDGALAHLAKAIDLKPSLRLQAGQDTDLEALYDNPAFGALLDAPARPRPAARERSGR